MPSTPARTDDGPPPTALERILAGAATALVGVALVGFIVTLTQIGMRETWPWLAEGIWPHAFLLPVVALPVGLLCVLGLLLSSMIRKSRRA